MKELHVMEGHNCSPRPTIHSLEILLHFSSSCIFPTSSAVINFMTIQVSSTKNNAIVFSPVAICPQSVLGSISTQNCTLGHSWDDLRSHRQRQFTLVQLNLLVFSTHTKIPQLLQQHAGYPRFHCSYITNLTAVTPPISLQLRQQSHCSYITNLTAVTPVISLQLHH